QQLDVFFHPAIQRKADLPRTGIDLWVFDRCLIHHVVRTDRRVPLCNVKFVAMKITSAVEPCLFSKSSDVHNERVTFPTSPRPAHPGGCWSLLFGIHADDTRGTCKLIGHEDVR